MNTALMFSSKTDQWATPQYFFDELDAEFHFTLDAAADESNYKCERYYDMQDTRYRDVLTKRYIDGSTWEQIAVEMGYDYFYVKGALHGYALKAAEEYIKAGGANG